MRPAHWSLRQLLRLSAGLLIWSSAFVTLYAGISLGCQSLSIPVEAGLGNPLSVALVLATLLHAGALMVLLLRQRWQPVKAAPGEDEASRLLRHRIETLVLWTSLAGVVFIAFPVLMVPPCAG